MHAYCKVFSLPLDYGPDAPLTSHLNQKLGRKGVKSQLFKDDDESRQTKMGDGVHIKVQLDSLSDVQEIKCYEFEGDC